MRGVLLAKSSRNDSRSTIHMEAIGQRGGESRPITALWRAPDSIGMSGRWTRYTDGDRMDSDLGRPPG